MYFVIGLLLVVANVLQAEPPKVTAELLQEVDSVPLKVQGEIPAWLSGTLVRNGPIRVTVNGKTTEHWLDGLAMLHAFAFDKGRVLYTNKFLRSDAYDDVFERGSIDYVGFDQKGTEKSIHNPPWHNANINVAKLNNEYVALYEIPLPVKFDLPKLNTLGVLNYDDQLPHSQTWESAHPHHDGQKGETINYLIEYGFKSYYVIYRIKDGNSTREVIGKIPVGNPAYMHSFAVTDHYVILTEFPLVVKPLSLLKREKPFIQNFNWEPERGTKILVVDRSDGKLVGTFKTDPFFAFHHANAFEDGDQIIFDIVKYKDAEIITGLKTHDDKTSNENKYGVHLMRYTIALKTGDVTSQELLSNYNEFPRINEAYDGKPYQFLYVADPRDPESSTEVKPIYKINTKTKEVLVWSEKGNSPSEAVFVANPNGKSEDDGVVLAVMLDPVKKTSFLLVLDGQTFKEKARAEVVHVVPEGLHGQFFKP